MASISTTFEPGLLTWVKRLAFRRVGRAGMRRKTARGGVASDGHRRGRSPSIRSGRSEMEVIVMDAVGEIVVPETGSVTWPDAINGRPTSMTASWSPSTA